MLCVRLYIEICVRLYRLYTTRSDLIGCLKIECVFQFSIHAFIHSFNIRSVWAPPASHLLITVYSIAMSDWTSEHERNLIVCRALHTIFCLVSCIQCTCGFSARARHNSFICSYDSFMIFFIRLVVFMDSKCCSTHTHTQAAK